MILELLTSVVLLIFAVPAVTEILDYRLAGLYDICEVNIETPYCQELFRLRII